MSERTPDTELTDLLAAHLEDELDEAQSTRLAELLGQDQAAIDQYADYMINHALLRAKQVPQLDPVDLPIGLPTTTDEASHAAHPRPKSLLKWASRHPKGPAVAIAATVLIAALVVMGLIPVKDWMAGRVKKSGGDEAQEKNDQEFVARLSNWQNDKWLEGTRPPLDDPRLKIGRRLKIKSGVIEVTYLTGARVVIEGPAEFWVGGTEAEGTKAQRETARSSTPKSSLLNPKSSLANSGFLRLGSLVARVEGKKAQGFSIDTPSARVEDLGTEFGVEVSREGDADVLVLSGEVDVVREATKGRPVQRVRLATNQGAFVAGSGGAIERRATVDAVLIAKWRRQLDEALPSQATGIATTQPAPEGYRAIEIVNHSFEHDPMPDGKAIFGLHAREDKWRTPFGWKWTTGAPSWGGIANPSDHREPRYEGTLGDGSNGAMHGSHVLVLDTRLPAGGGIEQMLEETFAPGAVYELRVAAGVRENAQHPPEGTVKLLAGENELASLELPGSAPGLFRDYTLRYTPNAAHEPLAGNPLKVQLLIGDRGVDYDNVRLYVKDP